MRKFCTLSNWDGVTDTYKTAVLLTDTNEVELFHTLENYFVNQLNLNELFNYKYINIIRLNGDIEYESHDESHDEECMIFSELDEIESYALDECIWNNYVYDGKCWKLNGYSLKEYEDEFLDSNMYIDEDDYYEGDEDEEKFDEIF